jgi:hypothetical protein
MNPMPRVAQWLLFGLLQLACTTSAMALTLTHAGGGALSPPVTRGDYLYVGTGASLTVWNLADPAEPVLAGGSAAPAPGPIRALAMVGDYLYAAWNTPLDTGGILVYSLADPAHPAVVADFEDYIDSDFKRPSGLGASGNYVYVGDADNGLVVLDASDPLAPEFVTLVGGIYEFDAMAVFGDTLYSSGSSFIGGRLVHIVDLSDPALPVETGSVSMDGSSVLRAVLTDGYAIGVGNDLLVYDLTDPANATQIFSAPIDVATHAIRHDANLYLVGASGIQVWDFTDPAAPALLDTVAMATFLPDQAADTPLGPVILTHTDRGFVLDIADPAAPVLAGGFVLPGGVAAHAGEVTGGRLFVAQEAWGLGVADPASLAPLGLYDADLPPDPAARDFEDVSVDGDHAYLSAWGYGVLIADLADPVAPVEVGRFAFPFASTIEAVGDRVYVASATNGGILRILDVSDPANPAQLGSLLTSQTYDIEVRGDYAYLVDGADFGDGGLRVVDVSDPAAPTLVGQDTGCSYANGLDVAADGNTVYIACSSNETFANELRIVDTSDKANPMVVGSVTLPGSEQLPDYNVAYSVVVDGDVAYVGNENGVDEIDIATPTAPAWVARYPTGYSVRKVALAPDGRLFAFASQAGVFVLDPVADRVFTSSFE